MSVANFQSSQHEPFCALILGVRWVKDKDVMAVTVMGDVDSEEEEFEDGWDAIQNNYLIII